MKKRLLALLLALVLTISMLPTAFALDADEPAGSAGSVEVENPTEGETEEKPAEEPAEPEQPEEPGEPEEPEQPGETDEPAEPGEEPAPEEPSAEELLSEEAAEAAALAANYTHVFVLGEKLQFGYYLTKDSSDGTEGTEFDLDSYQKTEPVGRRNYIYYTSGGYMEIHGDVRIRRWSENGDIQAVMEVQAGNLRVEGNGQLTLDSYGVPALYVKPNATIDFALAEIDDDFDTIVEILGDEGSAVVGDLKISSAERVIISSQTYDDETTSPNTIDGNADINAVNVRIENMGGGACVNGDLAADCKWLYVWNMNGATDAVLKNGTYQIKGGMAILQNDSGAVIEGDLTADECDNIGITGCTTGDIPVVRGNITASDGKVWIQNSDWNSKQSKTDGPLLVGNLTVTNAKSLQIRRKEAGTTPLITGNVSLTNCTSDNEVGYRIYRIDSQPAIDGNLTLANSSLDICNQNVKDPNVVYNTPGVVNCSLTMSNSGELSVAGKNNGWNAINIREEYEWYAGEYSDGDLTYTRSTKTKYTTSTAKDKPYLVIRSGAKMGEETGETTQRSATYHTGVALEGIIGQPMKVQLYVALTGDTLKYQAQSMADLTKYFTINAPDGTWSVKAAAKLTKGGTQLPLYIIGTPTAVCSNVPLQMTLSGSFLASGEDLTVTETSSVYWNIQRSAAGVDYDDIRTAEEFAKAIGGDEFAEVSGDTVTLKKSARAAQSITMTGEFTVDLNGYELYYGSANDPVLRSGAGKQTIRGSSANGAYNYIHNSIMVTGGELTLEQMRASFVTVENGTLHMNDTTASAVDMTGGVAEVSGSTLNVAGIKGGELILRETEIKRNSTTSLRVNGGKATIENGTQIPCIVLMTGGELEIKGGTFYGYEGHWLQQTGGKVTVRGGDLTGTMLVKKGTLDLLGGNFSGGDEGELCLYQSGGKVTAENVWLSSLAMEERVNGETYFDHRCVWMDGGELTLKNTDVTGAVNMYGGAKLDMQGGSIQTVNAFALYIEDGTAAISSASLDGRNLAVNLGGKNASVTLNSGELSGGIWGVMVSGGSFTMLDGAVAGAEKGVFFTEAKGRLTVKGGSVTADEVALYVQKGNTVQLSGGTFTGGERALFAENGTMKGWLVSGCEMTGNAVPGGFDPAKAVGTGSGTVTIIPADESAVERVIALIDDIGTVEMSDECLAKIVAAEQAYAALSAAQQKQVKNYKTLTKAREQYNALLGDRVYAEQAKQVNDLMAEIPADTADIGRDDLDRIEQAENAYNAVAKDKNVKKYLDNNLVKRLKAARKAYDKNAKAAQKVQDMIDKLPDDVSKLDVSKDRKAIDKAQKAYDKLTGKQPSFLEPGAEDKLNACAAQMELLTSCEKVIKDAQTAIKKLPVWSKIKASDKTKVETAEAAMEALRNAGEQMGIELSVGEANEEKYNAAIAYYYDFKGTADGYRETYLAPLADCEADKEHKQAIEAARTAYKNLGSEFTEANVVKNVQSFITKQELSVLTNLEKQLKKNEKAAQKVTKLIEKLPNPDASFTAKDIKAIDAAWKAYQNLKTDAERSFVEDLDKLTECYYTAHPDQRPEPVGGNTFHIRFIDSATNEPIQLKDIFASGAKLGMGRNSQSKKEVETSVYKNASATDTEVVIEHVPEPIDKQGYMLYFDGEEVSYAYPGSTAYISDSDAKADASGGYVVTIKLVKHYLRVEGVEVTEANAANILEDNTVSYNSSTKTLTLNNARLCEKTNLVNVKAVESNMRNLTLSIPEGTTSYIYSNETAGLTAIGLHIVGKGTLRIATDPNYYALSLYTFGAEGELSITETTVIFEGASGSVMCSNLVVDRATIKNSGVAKYDRFFAADNISITNSTIDLTISSTNALWTTGGGISIKDSDITLYTTMQPGNRSSAYLLFAECGALSIEGNSTVNLVAPNMGTDEDHSMLSATNSITIGKGLTIRNETGKTCEVYQPGEDWNYSVRCKDGTYPKQIFIASAKTPIPAIRTTNP